MYWIIYCAFTERWEIEAKQVCLTCDGGIEWMCAFLCTGVCYLGKSHGQITFHTKIQKKYELMIVFII